MHIQVENTSSIDENFASKDISDEELNNAGFSTTETSRLLRKIDKTLLPFLALLYLLSFLDRSNIGNAKLAGLEEDLGMDGPWDYAVSSSQEDPKFSSNHSLIPPKAAVAIFFPFYVLAEVPSNTMLRILRPSIWIPSLMVAWGTMTVMLGIVKNFAGLLAVRSLLGLAEGGLFPGVTY